MSNSPNWQEENNRDVHEKVANRGTLIFPLPPLRKKISLESEVKSSIDESWNVLDCHSPFFFSTWYNTFLIPRKQSNIVGFRIDYVLYVSLQKKVKGTSEKALPNNSGFPCWLCNLNKTELEWVGLTIRMCTLIRNEHVYFFVKVHHLKNNNNPANQRCYPASLL